MQAHAHVCIPVGVRLGVSHRLDDEKALPLPDVEVEIE
jgi:hypothetical protein